MCVYQKGRCSNECVGVGGVCVGEWGLVSSRIFIKLISAGVDCPGVTGLPQDDHNQCKV